MTNATNQPLSSRRSLPAYEDFLKNISPQSPAGNYLRYEAIYDDIRNSRQEDDPRLSMGIWQTELKRADWNKIEKLCIEALTKSTKDLQISAWLSEAWTCLDNLEGYNRGILLTSDLCKTFWQTIHPLPQDEGDFEKRYLILDWMDTILTNRLLMIPLTQSKLDQSTYGLGYYKSAQYGDAAQKRSVQSNMQADPSKAVGTVENFQRSMEHTPYSFLIKLQSDLARAIELTTQFKNTMMEIAGKNAPSFLKILTALKDMTRIVQTTLQTRPPPAPEPNPEIEETAHTDEPLLEEDSTATNLESSEELATIVPQTPTPEQEAITTQVEEGIASPDIPVQEEISEQINSPVALSPELPTDEVSIKETLVEDRQIDSPFKTREEAFQHLKNIADYLEQSDPHSLAPQLIRQLIRWEQKNIVEVLSEIAKTPQEYKILMKILGNSKKKK